jgi:hypothetical protein
MDLGIAVVSYNTRALTADCLDSVYRALAASPLRAHVWVVDNASADGSAAFLRERFPQATLVASAENLGFARGTNLCLEMMAAAATPPRHMLLLNPDTLVVGDALERLVAFLDAHPRVGVVGAQLRYGDGSFQHGAFHFPTLLMALFDFWPRHRGYHRLMDSPLNGRYPSRRYAAGEPFSIDHPLGAAMLVRGETLRQVGPLDERYFMYCEEIDWCMRIIAAGWQIYCVPQAIIVHLGGQAARQFRDKMFVALWRSRFLLFSRHYSPLYQRLVRVIVHGGLRRRIAGVQAALRRGEVSAEDAAREVNAYRQVLEL